MTLIESISKPLVLSIVSCNIVLSDDKLRNCFGYSLLESGLLFFGDSTRLFKKPLLQACTNINKQHLEWISPRTINEICMQKVGYLSNESNIYIGKQNPKTLKIIKGILKKNKSRII